MHHKDLVLSQNGFEAYITTPLPFLSRSPQIMGITERGGDCLAGIYLSVSEISIQIFIRYSRLVSAKLN